MRTVSLNDLIRTEWEVQICEITSLKINEAADKKERLEAYRLTDRQALTEIDR